MGINPRARARTKEPGKTGSYTGEKNQDERLVEYTIKEFHYGKNYASKMIFTCISTRTSMGSLSSHIVRGMKP